MLVGSQYFYKAEEGRFETPQQAAARTGLSSSIRVDPRG
jgi:hypothetical protein